MALWPRSASTAVRAVQESLDTPPVEGLLHTRDLARVMDGMIAQQQWGAAADIRALPAVEAAVRLFSTHVSGLPVVMADGSDLPRWLRRPRLYNDSFDLADIVQVLVDSMIFHGVGYLQCTALSDGDAPSWRVDWLDPDHVQAQTSTRAARSLSFLVDGEPMPMVPPDLGTVVRGRRYLLHIPYRVSVDRPWGTSPLIECAYMLRGHVAVESYAADLFGGSGVHAGGILTTTGDLTTTQAQQWKQQWDSTSGGVRVLGNGLEYRNELPDPNNLQLIEARSFNQSIVWSLLGVPQSIMGASLMGGQSSLSYSNSQDDNARYIANSLRSFTDQMAESLSRLMPPGRNAAEDRRVVFDFSEWEGAPDVEPDNAAV